MNEGRVGRAWAHGLFAPGPGEDMKAWVIALLPYGPCSQGACPLVPLWAEALLPVTPLD